MRIIVASRWPHRPRLRAASQSCSISRSVSHSRRGGLSSFSALNGLGPRSGNLTTVPETVVGVSLACLLSAADCFISSSPTVSKVVESGTVPAGSADPFRGLILADSKQFACGFSPARLLGAAPPGHGFGAEVVPVFPTRFAKQRRLLARAAAAAVPGASWLLLSASTELKYNIFNEYQQ